MTRLFAQHTVRQVLSLDGLWEVVFPKNSSGENEPDLAGADRGTLLVPGVWENLDGRKNYRGQAVFRREFFAPVSGPARLVFKGVSHTGWVSLDGNFLGKHHNAFTPFTLDLPHLEAGRHELQVRVSNEHGALSALHVPNDYYNYGGINRPVEIQFLCEPLFIERIHAAPRRLGDGTWSVALRAFIRNLGTAPAEAALEITAAGATVRIKVAVLAGELSVFDAQVACADVDCWSPAAPRLYWLEGRLVSGDGNTFDDWRERIGFRTFEVSGETLRLNDEPVFLAGFCRHEDHPDYGCALPVEIMFRDLQLAREMGANAMRTTHYPADERFLDLCDEMGFLVWEENHARGLFKGGAGGGDQSPMEHPLFREQCRLVNEEMVLEHFNHPSIVMWGILNECDSFTDHGRSCYAEQFAQIRELDSTRPVTYAACHMNDRCQDLPDIAGWNRYAGWYSDKTVEEDLADLLAYAEPSGMAGKPLILSEFGGEGIAGFSDPVRRPRWSLERQADILQRCLEVYLKNPRIAGAFIWQFCDVRVDDSWAFARPRCINGKGIVDDYRRYKPAAGIVRDAFRNRLGDFRTGNR